MQHFFPRSLLYCAAILLLVHVQITVAQIPLPPVEQTVYPLELSPQTKSLDQMSDAELLDLYATTYAASLRGQTFDLSSLVQKGHVVFQIGYTFSQDVDDLDFRTEEHTFPEFLLRYRLLNRIELRASWAGVMIDTLTDELSGISDTDTRAINPSFGMRIGLWKQHGSIPRTSFTLSTPYDLDGIGTLNDRLSPSASVGYSWLFDKMVLVSGSTGVIWTRDEEQRYQDIRQSLTYACFVSDDWDVHLTWRGLFPEGNRIDGLTHSLGPGISHRVSESIQWDILSSFGLDEVSPDLTVQFLVSRRF